MLFTNEDFEYINYINTHRKYALNAANVLVERLKEHEDLYNKIFKSENDLNEFKYNILSHDLTKFNEIEFKYYRMKYYPSTEEKNKCDSDEDFKATVYENLEKIGWTHHKKHNPHHPEYHLDGMIYNGDDVLALVTAKPVRMSNINILEMLCDWMSCGRIFGTPTKKWYIENEQEKFLNRYSNVVDINLVERILDLLNIDE